MDKPISVGDLVQIVRWPHACQGDKYLGQIFSAGQMYDAVSCNVCKELLITPTTLGPAGRGIPLRWLKRIPPLEELEGEKRDEEITA